MAKMKVLFKLAFVFLALAALLFITTFSIAFSYEDVSENLRGVLRRESAQHISLPEGCSSRLINLVSYWKPRNDEDESWESPYKLIGPSRKYVVFEPDEGGWNNLRKCIV